MKTNIMRGTKIIELLHPSKDASVLFLYFPQIKLFPFRLIFPYAERVRLGNRIVTMNLN